MNWIFMARVVCLAVFGLLATVLVESLVSWEFLALIAAGWVMQLYAVLGVIKRENAVGMLRAVVAASKD